MKVSISVLLFLWILLTNMSYAQQVANTSKRCKSAPPALQHVTGPAEVCFGNSILLEATPTDNHYYLQWEPLDTNSTYPALAEGNSVTFSFGYKAINGIAVRQVDKATGCRSEAYIHPVEAFTLKNGDIPGMMTVHEGDFIRLELPDQSEQVVYEWIIEDGTATVVGDNFSPSVDILINYLDPSVGKRYPHRTRVTLKRKCCGGGEVKHSLLLVIEEAEDKDNLSTVVLPPVPDMPPTPVIDTIIAPVNICESRPVIYQAVVQGEHLRYLWDFGDGTFNYGNPVWHTYGPYMLANQVTLVVTDTFGRGAVKRAYATINANLFEYASLQKFGITGSICPGNLPMLVFSPAAALNDYRWLPVDTITRDNRLTVTQTGDYIVEVSDRVHGCRAGAICNVTFRNAPLAEIVGDTLCKVGGKVRLLGNTGTLNQYSWHITGPEEYTFDTPNIVFKPRKAGVYSVALAVTNRDGCAAEAECEVRVF